MVRLTKIFELHRTYGKMVEIKKTIGDRTICRMPASKIHISKDGISIDDKEFRMKKWFFTKLHSA